MYSRRFAFASCVSLLGLFATKAAAHGGGLNAQGCHNNRKTGDYHCHRSPSAPPAASAEDYQPQRSGLFSSETGANEGGVHRIMTAQTALRSLGFDVGAADGRMGANTLAALRSFESAKGVTNSGQIDDATIFLLVAAMAEKAGC